MRSFSNILFSLQTAFWTKTLKKSKFSYIFTKMKPIQVNEISSTTDLVESSETDSQMSLEARENLNLFPTDDEDDGGEPGGPAEWDSDDEDDLHYIRQRIGYFRHKNLSDDSNDSDYIP